MDKNIGFEKLAIVGTAASSVTLANNLDESWGIYCLNAAIKQVNRYDLHFELHKVEYLESLGGMDIYFDVIRQSGSRSMMQDAHDAFPEAQIYPLEAITKAFGRYFNNSASFMLAYAMWANPNLKYLKVYGIEMSGDDEYSYQRPNFEHYLGIAKGRGIVVSLPDSCPLLHCAYMYGFERPSPVLAHAEMVHKMFKGTHEGWDTKRKQAEANEDYYRGGKDSMERFLRTYKGV